MRGEGIEPSRLTAYAPQTYASTNSATRAYLFNIIQRRRDKAFEQWMGNVRLGLEFRMELAADEPRMILDLNDLH